MNRKTLLTLIISIWSSLCGMIIVFASSLTQRNIYVTIQNSYSWHIQRAPTQSFVSAQGLVWTLDETLDLLISATTGSTYTTSGDVSLLTGVESGSYTIMQTVTSQTGEGNHTIQVRFDRDREPYFSNTLSYMVDTTAPTQATVQLPIDNSIVNTTSPMVVSWLPSNDLGVGLWWYHVFFSLHPSFTTPLILDSQTWSSIMLPANAFPLGTIYRYVESYDLLGNMIASEPWFFHYGNYTDIGQDDHISQGAGAWWSSMIRDDCPQWDRSMSYYDHICGQESVVSPTSGVVIDTHSGSTLFSDEENQSWMITEETPLDTVFIHTDNVTSGVIIQWLLELPPNASWNLLVLNYETIITWQQSEVLAQQLRQLLLYGYDRDQSLSYVSMRLPDDVYNTDTDTVPQVYAYEGLIQHYHPNSELYPIGYLMVYFSWIVTSVSYLLSLFYSYFPKKVPKNLTRLLLWV